MAAVSPLAEQMGMLLAKCTPEEITEIFSAVNKMKPVGTQPAVASSAVSQCKKRSKKSAVSKAAPGGESTFTVLAKGVKSLTPSNVAPTRPLNSWMAFRSYYSPIFKSFQQKEISGLLTRLWQNDPFKAKWSILAKAYSMIREHKAKNIAPLDTFFSHTCPHIGMLNRQEYFAVMGWEVVEENGEKKMERRFIPDVASFPVAILTTNLSAEQVVAYCYHVKYVEDGGSDITRRSIRAATLTMAAQPPNMSPSSFVQFSTSMDTANVSYKAAPEVAVSPSLGLSARLLYANNSGGALTRHTPRTQMRTAQAEPAVTTRVQAALETHNNQAMGASSELRQFVHDLNASGQQYPWNGEFDPYGSSDMLFNPYAGDANLAFSTGLLGTYLAPADTENPDMFGLNDFLSNDVFDLNK